MWETWALMLGQEDPLEEDMATHSSILDWEITWTGGIWHGIVHGDPTESDMVEHTCPI